MTIGELIQESVACLPHRAGLPDPRREARWLVARLLGHSEAWVLAHPEKEVGPAEAGRLRAWVARRACGEPAHYIVGACEFFGRDLRVGPAVLIPRPESELVVTAALALPLPAPCRVLDVGAGSGALAITLALELECAEVIATDVSCAAAAMARGNASRLGARVAISVGDLVHHLCARFDLVVANLPYVPDEDISGLSIEVRDHEPHLALAGGPGGTVVLSRFVDDLPGLLADGGFAALELGPGQAASVAARAARVGLDEHERIVDASGVERVLVLRLTSRLAGAP